jgi:serine/threonine protein kinase/formylglycine-generating enzyme required for sulfatase activity
MTEAFSIHPGDEMLLALSLGQLGEAELLNVSSHLSGCRECCRRIDELHSDDLLVSRLQQSAGSRERVIGTPAEHRSAARALRRRHKPTLAARGNDWEAGAGSGHINASTAESDADRPPYNGEPFELSTFLAPPERPDEIGRLGPYRILSVLGKGGMGVVFRAHDPALDRVIALKVMLPSMAATPTARGRFLREARSVAALKHPHVVTVFQVGEDRGVPFLAMEFLEGEPLENRIRREGRLPLAEVLRIGRETALALAAAHARGLVHRDIKPANLWLEGPTGHVKVLDFGLAWAATAEAHLTQFGTIVGTLSYMAPEQAEGKPAEPRCDLFSLGCVLYQMSSGTLPFPGETSIAVLRALALHEPPPVGEMCPDAPPGLSALVVRLLAKNPDDRLDSAEELAGMLRTLEEFPTSAVLPKTRPRRNQKFRKLRAPAAVAVLALALSVVLWPTPRGTVRIESDDPAVEVVFDKDGPTIKGADKEPITLRAGEHGILIKRGDFTFEAEKLLVKKGTVVTLKVELHQGKVRVLHDGRVVANQAVPWAAPPLAKAPFDAPQARDHQQAWAKYLGIPLVTTNSLGMKFRLIPPGEFTMGVTDAEAKAWSKVGPCTEFGKLAVPAHAVRLTQPFYLAERELQYPEFVDVMKREPGNEPTRAPFNELAGAIWSSCTWFDGIAFCNQLSEREGLIPAYRVAGREVTANPVGTGYRLPTEAEWEFACRAGTTSLWYFGLTVQDAQTIAARGFGEAFEYLRHRTSVRNAFGLVDMYAGSWEWCWDWYAHDYYQQCAERGMTVDPQGPVAGEARIVRGGTYFAHSGGDMSSINSAVRLPRDPETVAKDTGFGRLMLPVPAKGNARPVR